MTTEISLIRTMEWPMDPFLPMKRLAKYPAVETDLVGFIYRPDLETKTISVYLGSVEDIVMVDGSFTMEDTMVVGTPFTVFHFNPKLCQVPSAEVLVERLRNFRTYWYQSLEELVADGWVVD